MKHINVLTFKKGEGTSTIPECQSVGIHNTQEKYKILVECLESNQKERELAKIEITLPDNKVFSGTIQDVSSIPVILKNAFNTLSLLSAPEEDKEDVTVTLNELQHALSLFK